MKFRLIIQATAALLAACGMAWAASLKPNFGFFLGDDQCTGNWGSDWETLSVDAKLNSAANTIVLSTIGKGGMYIDGLTVR